MAHLGDGLSGSELLRHCLVATDQLGTSRGRVQQRAQALYPVRQRSLQLRPARSQVLAQSSAVIFSSDSSTRGVLYNKSAAARSSVSIHSLMSSSQTHHFVYFDDFLFLLLNRSLCVCQRRLHVVDLLQALCHFTVCETEHQRKRREGNKTQSVKWEKAAVLTSCSAPRAR